MPSDDNVDDIDAIIEVFETITGYALTPGQREQAVREIGFELSIVTRYAKIDTATDEGRAALFECIDRLACEAKDLVAERRRARAQQEKPE